MGTIGLSILIYGMAIVISFAVAALIKAIVAALPMLEKRAEPAPKPAASAAAAPVGVPAEHIAAISAAVADIIGPHHILHIEDRGRAAVWTSEGRMIHQTSHAVPRSTRR